MGNALPWGFLRPADVQVCFETLETRISLGEIAGPDSWDAVKLNARCGSRFDPPYQNLIYELGTLRDPCYVVVAERAQGSPRCSYWCWYPFFRLASHQACLSVMECGITLPPVDF